MRYPTITTITTASSILPLIYIYIYIYTITISERLFHSTLVHSFIL